MLEQLETRRLMADLVGTQLQIILGDGDDVVRINRPGVTGNSNAGIDLRVETNGSVQTFNNRSVESIFMSGGKGNDKLFLRFENVFDRFPVTQPATIIGGEGDDSIIGGDGNDRIEGGNDDDSLDGGSRGDDLIFGGRGDDFVDGDSSFGDLEPASLKDKDRLFGGPGNDILAGGLDDDFLDGGSGDNILSGEDGNDVMTAGFGRDNFFGGFGVDTVDYSSRTGDLKITIGGGSGETIPTVEPGGDIAIPQFENDRISGPPSIGQANNTVENIIGGSGSDIITATAGNIANKFIGNGGNDRLIGNGGDDVLEGGAGNDFLTGGDGKDRLLGGDGKDQLFGGTNKDLLFGGAGDDQLDGGLGADEMRGEGGSDVLHAADGTVDSVINGGDGFDVLDRDSNDPTAVSIESIL